MATNLPGPVRRLGDSDVFLPMLGLGCAAIGGLHGTIPDAEAARVIETAWQQGLRYFDTAPLYGRGLGEIRVGNALRALPRDQFVLSTKVGWLTQPLRSVADNSGLPAAICADYTYEGTVRSVEDSLNRTGLGRLDIVIVHDIDPYNHGERHALMFREVMEGALPALNDLRRDGLIGAVGIGVNSVDVCLDSLAHADFDCFILAGRYTLLDQSAAERGLLDACAARKVSVIAAAPFNSGILAGGPMGGKKRYNYRDADADTVARVREIAAICDRFGVDLMSAALHFPLLHRSVIAVLPGPRSSAQMEGIAAAFGREIPRPLWDALADAGLLELPGDLAHV